MTLDGPDMTIEDLTDRVMAMVRDERVRQETLKMQGKFTYTCADLEMSDGDKLAVLVEEVGEVGRAFLEAHRLANDTHNKHLLDELIQVAAVAVAWAESMQEARL